MTPFKHYLLAIRPVIEAHARRFWRRWAIGLASVIVLASGYALLLAPPNAFSPGTIVHIALGTSVPEIARELADAHVIIHPTLLRLILRVSGESGAVQMGTYQFATPQNALIIAYRLVAGDYGLPPIRMTFVEGVTAREAAAQIADVFGSAEAESFLSLAQSHEGYLFPDTYIFHPSTDAASIVAAMRTTFDKKISSISDDVSASGHTLSDIVIVASLVEKEARTPVDRRLIAGILWNRLALRMPLQVDAVFGYIFNRDTYSPSPADLKVASPYNTYLHQGLPPGPIGNPGLDALSAAAHPTKTTYLYYLTGKDGLTHYATTYAAHQANLKKYLQ